jgi:hypothetical protein
MLSTEDKARIQAEELFRDEVRRNFERNRPRSRSRRTWDFFNSSLGIWFLTSVLVGSGTYAFTKWRDSRATEAARVTSIKKLDTEVATRLDRFAVVLPRLTSSRSYGEALAGLEKPADNAYAGNGYPEYERRGLLSLLRELREIAPSAERRDLDRALRGALHLARIAAENTEARLARDSANASIDAHQRQTVVLLVNDTMSIARWRFARAR